MQILCGQCGALYDLDEVPRVRSMRCRTCGHEIHVGHFTLEDDSLEPDRDELFVETEPGFDSLARLSLHNRILVICSHCGNRLKVAKNLAGRVAQCPSCSHELHIPFLDEEDHFDLDAIGGMEDEIIELGEADYELAGDVIISGRWFRLTRRKLVFFVAAYVVIMTVVLMGGVLFRDPEGVGRPGGGETVRVSVGENRTGKATYRLGTVRWQAFASDTSSPAPPGRMYVLCSLEFQAGGDDLIIPVAGRGVVLEAGGAEYESLGRPGVQWPVPIPVSDRPVRIPAGQRAEIDLLFELPPGRIAGVLRMAGVAEVEVALDAPDPGPALRPGRYREHPPRHLKPLLRNPVMAAVQNAVHQHLLLEQRDGLWVVRIPEAGVDGTAERVGNDSFRVDLRQGANRLEGQIRAMPGGFVVLYLDPAPMHQVIYAPVEEPDESGAHAARRRGEDETTVSSDTP